MKSLFPIFLLSFLCFFKIDPAQAQDYTKKEIAALQSYTKEQVESLQQGAEHGDAKAQFHLGVMYLNGWGVSKDMPAAAGWFSKAAEQGDNEAQQSLGWLYAYGAGVEKNGEKSFFWYRKAAEQGNAYAQYSLGRRYVTGDGTAKNYAEAISWLTKAADQNLPVAGYDLAIMYMMGEGVKPDKQKAREWFQKSAALGFEDSKKALARIDADQNGDKFVAQQMNDIYTISKLLEEYKKKTGHYPFYNMEPVPAGYVKVGTLVTIGSAKAEKKLLQRANPFGISATTGPSSLLEAELKKELGREIDLPFDPQEEALYAPNAYYAYFSTDDEYMVMTFLYSANEYTNPLFNPHANIYAITSSDEIGKFWKSAGVRPRLFSDIKP